MVNRLPWDSDFFGLEVGQARFQKQSEFDSLEFINGAISFKVVYVFSKEKLEPIPSLEWLEEKVVFTKKLEFHSNLKSNMQEFNIGEHSLAQLNELTILSGVNSRFNVDQNFCDTLFEKLYLTWIEKSISNPKTKVFIKKSDSELTGFITLELSENGLAKIGLIAVNPNFQRQGIARELVKFSENYLLNQAFSELRVTTQSHNENAMNFYKSCKFQPYSSTHVYHYWNL